MAEYLADQPLCGSWAELDGEFCGHLSACCSVDDGDLRCSPFSERAAVPRDSPPLMALQLAERLSSSRGFHELPSAHVVAALAPLSGYLRAALAAAEDAESEAAHHQLPQLAVSQPNRVGQLE